MANVQNDVETLRKISIARLRRMNVSDRQTDDRRQTDGRRHTANVNVGSRSLINTKLVSLSTRDNRTAAG